MVIDMKPAATLAEAACQMEDAIGMCEGHYVGVCDVVLSNWSIVCRSVDINSLLKLADEMDRRQRDAATAATDGVVDAWCLREYADRIRKALGMSND